MKYFLFGLRAVWMVFRQQGFRPAVVAFRHGWRSRETGPANRREFLLEAFHAKRQTNPDLVWDAFLADFRKKLETAPMLRELWGQMPE